MTVLSFKSDFFIFFVYNKCSNAMCTNNHLTKSLLVTLYKCPVLSEVGGGGDGEQK